MRKTTKVLLSTLMGVSLTALVVAVAPVFTHKAVIEANAEPTYSSSLPTTISLKDNTEEEIRTYYGALNDKADSEKTGTNLLKSLRPILRNNLTYYPYGSINSSGVTQIYTITDRDWENSPASSIVGGTYNSQNNTITSFSHQNEKNSDPYVKMLYVDYENNGPTKFLYNNEANFDKEHVWSQSHGFKAASGANGPAGTDLHHLIAGEKTVNQQVHSNWSYGNVDQVTTSYDVATVGNKTLKISGNKLGTAKTRHSSDEVNKVFEPCNQDKGRIARALLYMVACYNNLSGNETITQYDPDLELVDYIIDGGKSEISSETGHSAKYGILSDLLEWNRLYAPDEFEIHRNNLIYNNYQHNRNPFIDFPQWADLIWGSDAGSKYADPETDTINKDMSQQDESKVILYNDTFDPALPTSNNSANTTPTSHTDTTSSINFKEQGIYKSSYNGVQYLMFKEDKSAYLYNTTSLGTISKIKITYSSNTSAYGKIGVYFGDSELSTRLTNDHNTVAGKSQTETFNATANNGFFQISISNYNVQITKIEIFTGTQVESLTLDTNSLDLFKGETYQINATVSPSNASNKTLRYESHNNLVASVSNTGLITATGTGSTSIVVSTTDGSHISQTIHVSVQSKKTINFGDDFVPKLTATAGSSVVERLDNNSKFIFKDVGLFTPSGSSHIGLKKWRIYV